VPTYQYDLNQLDEFVELIDRSIEELSAHRDGAKATVASIGEHYSGTAATAFTQSHDRWQASLQQHLDTLQAHRVFVADARANYAEAQRKNVEMLG
jgi:WXG100 family type VII secretion target